MSAAAVSQSLVARCRSCGGEVPLALAGPAPACRYCGSTDPLSPELSARVASMRARLEARSAQERHLTGKWAGEVSGIQGMTVAIWITTWVLFGGWATFFALSELPVPLLDFVQMTSFDDIEHSAKWWMLLGVAVGFPLSLFLYSTALFWLRSLGLAALPLAPAYPGAPPRCRCCAADLPSGGALRRCAYCGADSLIVGERYQKNELDVDRALMSLGQRFGKALESRVNLASKMSLFGALFPVGLLLFVLPIGAFLRVTFPPLWLLPVLLWFFAIAATGLAMLRKIPNVEPIDCLVLESEVTVWVPTQFSHKMLVNAQLFLGPPGAARIVAHVLGMTPRAFEMAGFVDTSGKRWKTTAWDLQKGGEPLEADAAQRLEPGELREPGATLKEGVKVDVCRILRQNGGFRVWLSPSPAPGDAPAYTLAKRKEAPLITA